MKKLMLVLLLLVDASRLTRAQEPKETVFSLRPEFERFGLKPRTQGYYACTVFATLGVLEFDYAKAGMTVKLSEQFAEWAAVKCSGQRFLNFPYRTVIEGIQKYGICAEEYLPYQDAKKPLRQPSKAAMEDAQKRRNVSVLSFHEWNKAFGFSDKEIESMCHSIAGQKAISCGFRWPSNEAAALKSGYTFDTRHAIANLRANQGVIGHTVVIVGYEKNKEWEGGGRFEFRNSFGEQWGQTGYGWVTFEYLRKHGVMAFAVHGP
jgi:hypothetical protein